VFNESVGGWVYADEVIATDYFTGKRKAVNATTRLANGYIGIESRMAYHTNVLDTFKVPVSSLKKGVPYFGVEWEINVERVPDMWLATDRKAIVTRDGSLGDDGVEVVTLPMTLSDHQQYWPGVFDRLADSAAETWTDGRCGIHVHVSRSSFTRVGLLKFIYFLNRSDVVRFVARRDSSEYAARNPLMGLGKNKTTPVNGRYSIVNTRKSETIEVRAFATTDEVDELLGCVELVAAARVFTETTGRHDLTDDEFLVFLEGARKEYPRLYSWLRLMYTSGTDAVWTQKSPFESLWTSVKKVPGVPIKAPLTKGVTLDEVSSM
jgi:hypothetical protein